WRALPLSGWLFAPVLEYSFAAGASGLRSAVVSLPYAPAHRVTPLVDSDAALVEAYRERGDQSAFAELVRRYREPVFRLALSIMGPAFAGEAEEVAQEVFVRVHRGLTSFRGEAQFSSWIYRIAFNQALNLKERVRYRVPHLSEEAIAETA